MSNDMTFSPEQQLAIDIRNTNVVVSASAGSGKTRVLVERLCQLVIKDHMPIDSILAMTFTNAAAAEMRDRLRLRLLEEKQDDYISQQLALLETAHICTIDSFCLSVVQNYYYKIPISYTQANQLASDAQQKEAFDQGYQKALEILNPIHLLDYKSLCRISDDKFKKMLKNCINLAWAKANPEQWFEDIKNDNMSDKIDTWFFQFFIGHLMAIDELCDSGTDHPFFLKKKESLIPCMEACRNKDYKTLYFEFKKHLLETGYQTFSKKKDENHKAHSALKTKINDHEKAISETLFEDDIFESDSINMKQIRDEFCDLCLEIKRQFSLIKAEMEVVDFGDIETMTLQLFQDPIVQNEYRDKFEAILIDEFQDTNDLQESIIQSIARKNNVFRVGDVKQSIYGFRQARPDIMRHHMSKDDEYNTTLVMDNNYRSNQSIVDFNNDFYQEIMNSSLLGQQFEDIDIAHTGLESQRNDTQYPIRMMYIDQDEWTAAHDEEAPNPMEVLAQDILRQHEKGVPFHDICILLRSRKPDTAYKEIFDAYEIPYVANVKTGFYTNKSVQIIVSTLSALMNPYDDTSLTACLLSPLTSVTTEQLAQASINKKKSTPLYQHIKDMDFMDDFHTLETYKYELPSVLIQKLYAYRDFYMSSCTNQDRINLDFLLEKAYGQDNAKKFIQQLKEDEKEDSVSEKSVYRKKDDVVFIETMHGSKGLQYPIVYILYGASRDKDKTNLIQMDADLGISLKSITSDGTVKRTSKEEIAILTKRNYDLIKEEMRILYVATTRAQKELIFIDSIKDISELNGSMNTHALLGPINYTHWLFYTYFDRPNSIVEFDKVTKIEERPPLKKPVSRKMLLPLYNKEVEQLETMTASATKIKKEWQPFEILSDAATKRGTLFHEAMATSYPYTEDALKKVAKRYNYTLTSTDLKQLLQVNESELYKEWMNEKHQFECSYILEKDHKVIHGFMDLVIWTKEKVIIVDYKTDTVENENELIEKYKSQLDTYQQAMEQIQDKPVSTYIYSFHLGAIIAINA